MKATKTFVGIFRVRSIIVRVLYTVVYIFINETISYIHTPLPSLLLSL
jgi:hypothetical protein